MALENKLDFCICCMCGLPASGKSTKCEQLKLLLQNNCLVLILNYDKILLDSSQDMVQLWKSLASQQTEDGKSIMKSARAQILNVVEFFIQQLKTTKTKRLMSELNKPSYIIEDVWHSVLTLCQDSLYSCDFEMIHRVLFLIDDNMFLSSMRYEYYKLAKLYKTGFCEVFVNSSVQTARERNKNRHGRDCIDEDVIERMSQQIEIPDSSKNYWEKYNIMLNTDATSDWKEVTLMIDKSFANPVHPSAQVSEEEKMYSKSVCSTNLIHQADLILRKCVSKTMVTGKEASKDLKLLSKRMMCVKEDILSMMKTGGLCIPDSITLSDLTDSSKDENSELFKYIENIFEYNLVGINS